MSNYIKEEQLLQTGNLEFLAKQVVEGFITGLHKSPFHGFSVEFAEHRLYNTGESTKHIDWKLYARTDKLFIKRYEEETNLRCQLIIDCSSSMFYPEDGLNKITFSAYAAASLIKMLKKQRDASGVSLIADEILFHSPCKSSSTHQKLLYSKLEGMLAQNTPNRKSNIAANLHQLAEMIHKRSLVIIFSDMLQNTGEDDELFSALQHLKYNKHEVILFHVEDKKTEVSFDFTNRPYLFIDSETGEKIKLFPNQIKEHYLKAVEAYKHTLKLKCAQYKIDLVEAEVSTDFSQILLPFLVKRSKLV
ncbi:hypothetical protein AEM51_11010 [Bacteroidetes bacterium UKL13-3]|jgi:uncharacterized protein (DUF58 family)|nr:hypothetical protein AEM51_11010 [Bacteroidetes bacterium UKL13-3]HCP93281.1 DUF58 domain-containing protein [Bacteroidota bacterium]